jgi:16S rRNA (guanine527-N7)-methyltransferase
MKANNSLVPSPSEIIVGQLNAHLARAGLPTVERSIEDRFDAYLSLILRWNARTSLTAIRNPEGIISRHFVESIASAAAVPKNVRTLLDFGSGAGFPGIPIALCRPEISVTLAESQNKKAAFLREAVRSLELKTTVHAGRAESLATAFDCVILRAVDRMEAAVSAASDLVSRSGWIMVLTTRSELPSMQAAAGAGFTWQGDLKLPMSLDRIIAMGRWTTNAESASEGVFHVEQ